MRALLNRGWAFRHESYCECGNKPLEAGGGIEPPNRAFAEPCLTTWLPRQSLAEKRIAHTGLEPVHQP